jgi:hypothetical protein
MTSGPSAADAQRIASLALAGAVFAVLGLVFTTFPRWSEAERLRDELGEERAEVGRLRDLLAREKRTDEERGATERPPVESPPALTAAVVDSAFHEVLERPPRADELQAWGSQGATASGLRQALATSVEGSERIHGLYQTFLARRAEPEGHAFWTGILSHSGMAAVRSGIQSSPEANQKRALQKPACDPPWNQDGRRKLQCPSA